MSKQKVYFRADAGSGIGYGHFIRSLALADMLREDFDCTFFTTSPSDYQKGEMGKVCSYVSLCEEIKFEDFLNCLHGDEIVVLDNYFYTTEYQKLIKEKGSILVCIDDMHDKYYVADLIINQGMGYSERDYSCADYTHFAFGLKYILLRKPFFEASKKSMDYRQLDNYHVLVAFGGSDPLNLTQQAINAIINDKRVNHITAIIGDSYAEDNIVVDSKDSKVSYYKNLSENEIADLFLSVDYAVLPASTMMNEALACGTRIIGGYFIVNQEHDYEMYVKENLIQGIGDYTSNMAFTKLSEQFDLPYTCKRKSITADTPSNYINLFKSLLK
jgi:UDP-2,4-diacetamido-2,4,6-trideoxy-beta-L-altropyranose hydrolase